MSYLIDSDWTADYLKGRATAVTLLDHLFADGLAISIVTFAEVYEGVYYGTNPQQNEAIFRRFLRGVPVLPITDPPSARCPGAVCEPMIADSGRFRKLRQVA